MQVTVDIPEEIVEQLASTGREPARAALEALAIESYRSGALTPAQTRRLLGFETRYELDGFLKQHHVEELAYDLVDLESDRSAMRHPEADAA